MNPTTHGFRRRRASDTATEYGHGQHDEDGRDAVPDRIYGVRGMQICDQPDREVERRDVHREDRIREVVQGPAGALSHRRALR